MSAISNFEHNSNSSKALDEIIRIANFETPPNSMVDLINQIKQCSLDGLAALNLCYKNPQDGKVWKVGSGPSKIAPHFLISLLHRGLLPAVNASEERQFFELLKNLSREPTSQNLPLVLLPPSSSDQVEEKATQKSLQSSTNMETLKQGALSNQTYIQSLDISPATQKALSSALILMQKEFELFNLLGEWIVATDQAKACFNCHKDDLVFSVSVNGKERKILLPSKETSKISAEGLSLAYAFAQGKLSEEMLRALVEDPTKLLDAGAIELLKQLDALQGKGDQVSISAIQHYINYQIADAKALNINKKLIQFVLALCQDKQKNMLQFTQMEDHFPLMFEIMKLVSKTPNDQKIPWETPGFTQQHTNFSAIYNLYFETYTARAKLYNEKYSVLLINKDKHKNIEAARLISNLTDSFPPLSEHLPFSIEQEINLLRTRNQRLETQRNTVIEQNTPKKKSKPKKTHQSHPAKKNKSKVKKGKKPQQSKHPQKSGSSNQANSNEIVEESKESLLHPTSTVASKRFLPKDPHLNYTSRVTRWFELSDINSSLDPDIFFDYEEGRYDRKKMIFFHGFTSLVDQYLHLGIEGAQINPNHGKNQQTKTLFVEMKSSNGESYRGQIIYCIDENGECFHRYFKPFDYDRDFINALILKKAAEVDFPPLDISIQVSIASKPYHFVSEQRDQVIVDELFGKVMIKDFKNQSTITIFEVKPESLD